jgi:3-isopropylmalate dehydrogenase
MLRHSLGLETEAQAIEAAVESVLERGLRTPDLAAAGSRSLSTEQMGEAVAEAVRQG